MYKKRIVWISIFIIFCILLLSPLLSKININEIIQNVQNLPTGFKEIFMIGLIALQIIVAFIPGEPLELAAGYMFGAGIGTMICLIGSAIGTMMVYFLVKLFRNHIIYFMFDPKKVAEVRKKLEHQKTLFWIFILFLIPGTPKDIMTYIISLTDIKLSKWLMITTIGRIPSIITSTFITGSIKENNYRLAIMMSIVAIIILLLSSWVYKKLTETKE